MLLEHLKNIENWFKKKKKKKKKLFPYIME